MTPEMIAKNDPSQFADNIETPMLVVHGDKDYRVPIGEALALWWDLCNRSKHAEDPATMPHRFLYFPDENHWVLTPGHAVVWYETVLAFLRWHVLNGEETLPSHLG
jgi:dipeptidyl aminopeptidase/acylaminoacyl peptidase